VLLAQRLLQEGIGVEIDLANRQVVRGPPVRVDLVQLVAIERRIISRGANGSLRAAYSIDTNVLSFGSSDSATAFTGRARFVYCGGFSICFHIFLFKPCIC
jgi:hypothetical protein